MSRGPDEEPEVTVTEPSVVPLGSARVIPADQAPTRVRIARLITARDHGSRLLLGASWSDPGERTNTWSFEPDDAAIGADDHHYGEVDEFYYVVSGRFRLTWQRGEGTDEVSGAAEFGPDDAVHLPPGWRYQLENVGAEPGFFIYGMTPTPH